MHSAILVHNIFKYGYYYCYTEMKYCISECQTNQLY